MYNYNYKQFERALELYLLSLKGLTETVFMISKEQVVVLIISMHNNYLAGCFNVCNLQKVNLLKFCT